MSNQPDAAPLKKVADRLLRVLATNDAELFICLSLLTIVIFAVDRLAGRIG